MTARLPEWVGRYISIPYEEVNCWNLVKKVYATEYGIAIGDKEEQSQHLREKDWVDVIMHGMGYLEGDIILFRDGKLKKHVGVLLTHELMLHTLDTCNSCIERWESIQWRDRVVSIYRHKKRCSQ